VSRSFTRLAMMVYREKFCTNVGQVLLEMAPNPCSFSVRKLQNQITLKKNISLSLSLSLSVPILSWFFGFFHKKTWNCELLTKSNTCPTLVQSTNIMPDTPC
jgi:hypothetical protein